MQDKTAFPFTCKDANQYQYMESGMTLRQYYIGQALQGLLCSNRHFISTNCAAQQAIECADAVMDILEKKSDND